MARPALPSLDVLRPDVVAPCASCSGSPSRPSRWTGSCRRRSGGGARAPPSRRGRAGPRQRRSGLRGVLVLRHRASRRPRGRGGERRRRWRRRAAPRARPSSVRPPRARRHRTAPPRSPSSQPTNRRRSSSRRAAPATRPWQRLPVAEASRRDAPPRRRARGALPRRPSRRGDAPPPPRAPLGATAASRSVARGRPPGSALVVGRGPRRRPGVVAVLRARRPAPARGRSWWRRPAASRRDCSATSPRPHRRVGRRGRLRAGRGAFAPAAALPRGRDAPAPGSSGGRRVLGYEAKRGPPPVRRHRRQYPTTAIACGTRSAPRRPRADAPRGRALRRSPRLPVTSATGRASGREWRCVRARRRRSSGSRRVVVVRELVGVGPVTAAVAVLVRVEVLAALERAGRVVTHSCGFPTMSCTP